ncbi:class I SAM-dependent methyltransferase [Oleiagrimonas citrea]|uniref:Class I SAM-dependent methyltransferase n=2 Tax=Oleiagrimonas TaxID=1649642 RepID=A0A846ZLW3_9GAMM|nr:methyltransferase domain-containing protein [Oleiagrimonas citrea]NKZ38966.1 class I SAM-dependent methyltransferase [Oleiagrimonas citrea]
MRALLRAEEALLRASVPARAGSYGLYLGMRDGGRVCAESAAHWVRLHCDNELWRGSLHARRDEALPFAEGAFSVVVISHAQQFGGHSQALLHEAARVTAPGGTLALSGMHPFSAWAPWLSWCMRGASQSLQLRAPLHWTRCVVEQGFKVQGIHRFGRILPRGEAVQGMGSEQLGGGYLVVARKHPAAATPLRFARLPERVRGTGSLAPGAHRECA